jgi:hypothetical protein
MRDPARSLWHEAILTGMGGDNVFCSNFSSLPLVDRMRCEGPGRGAWETLKALEEITGATTLAIGWQRCARCASGAGLTGARA